MKYLCLAYFDEKLLEQLPPAEWKQLVRDSLDNDARLAEEGLYVSSAPLESVKTATTVRVRGGRPLVTDGPFAETKEQLAGFILIDAPDLDAAIAAAIRMPQARLGSLEIRPVRNLLDETEGW